MTVQQVVSWVVTGNHVTDPHERMAALRDDVDGNDDRQGAIEVGCGHQEEDGQRQIENAGDLDLSDVQWRPRRDARGLPREDSVGDAEGELCKTEELQHGFQVAAHALTDCQSSRSIMVSNAAAQARRAQMKAGCGPPSPAAAWFGKAYAQRLHPTSPPFRQRPAAVEALRQCDAVEVEVEPVWQVQMPYARPPMR